jgi:hypothetical protein
LTSNSSSSFKTAAKDIRNGYVLHFDQRIHRFVYHLHVTPQGIANVDNHYKKERPFFDSSFRPQPWSMAINDMTNKMNEPPLYFPQTLKEFFTWVWNLPISYPDQEIYIGDDDATGAFQHVKYNPNLVSLHASLVRNWLFILTRYLTTRSVHRPAQCSHPQSTHSTTIHARRWTTSMPSATMSIQQMNL